MILHTFRWSYGFCRIGFGCMHVKPIEYTWIGNSQSQGQTNWAQEAALFHIPRILSMGLWRPGGAHLFMRLCDQPGENSWKFSTTVGIEPGPRGGQTVRFINSPTELSWPGPWGGQTVRCIDPTTDLSWLNHLWRLKSKLRWNRYNYIMRWVRFVKEQTTPH